MEAQFTMTKEQQQALADARRRELELERRKLQIVSQLRLQYYKPHRKQDLFHRAGNAKYRLFRAGNRTGKTEAGVCEDCAWLLGERLWYPEGSPERKTGIPDHPVKGVLVAEDWDMVNDIFTSQSGKGGREGKFWKFLPPDAIAKGGIKKNQLGVIVSIETKRGSVLKFETIKSFKHDAQSAESADWDFAHFDEPCPELMFKAITRGLMDRGGKAWLTLTPLREPWIDDMFFPDGFNEEILAITNGYGNLAFWAITAETKDNPYLKPEDIEAYEATLSDDEKECRLKGIPLHKSGLVYKDFNKAIHVPSELYNGWKAFDRPPVENTIYCAIDPHPNTPHAVLYLSVSPDGFITIFDEIWMKGTVPEIADAMHKKEAGKYMFSHMADPFAFNESQLTRTSIATEFMDCGIILERATKEREAGTLIVQAIFKERRPDGKPVIHITPNCVRTLWEINRYQWKVNSDGTPANKLVDKDDHMMENLYRLLFDRPLFVKQEENRNAVEEEVFDRTPMDLEDVNYVDF